MLARPAAIKLIRPEMLGTADGAEARLAVHRFRRKAEAAASLRSPRTVELYDFGITEDRTLYFVMELLDGMDLETLVRLKGPLPAARVIHPANIPIGRLGLRHDFVKVLDFGLVKSVAAGSAGQSHPTGAGFAAGTPAYMAPEAALGEPIDGRADLYALGCVGDSLLTGRVVFEGNHGLQVIARHLRETPVPPSERTELPVPPALERVILACLAKAPADRPPTAAALAASLALIATEPWGEAQAQAWWHAHRAAS